MSLIRPFAAIAAASALSACASVGGLWPFGGDDAASATAPQEGRISILSLEQQLERDPDLATRQPFVPPPTAMTDWSQPGGLASNGPTHLAGGAALKEAWSRQIVEGSSQKRRLTAAPVVAEGRVFALGADQELRAVDASNGRALWSASLRPRETRDRTAIGGGVAVSEGRVYAVSGFGVVAAFEAASGREIWRAVGVAPFAGAPTVLGGRLYAVTSDSELFAINAATGDVLWTHQAIAEPARILAASSPAVVDDTVVAPFASGEVIALLAPNGRRLWVDALSRAGRATSLSAINDVSGRPVASEGVVYAVSHSGLLAAIDQRSGQRAWARSFASTQTPWVAGDALYAVSVDGELAAFDRATGRVFWITQLRRFEDEEDRKGRIVWAGPILVGGRLVLASSVGEVAFVAPETGALDRTIRIGDPVFIPPVAAGGTVYLLTDEGRLVALQ